MICKIKLSSYQYSKLADEDYVKLRNVLPDLPEEKTTWFHEDHLIDLSVVAPVLTALSLEVIFVPFKGTSIVTLKERIDHLEREHGMLKQDMMMGGQVVTIHVPNCALLLVNEVDHLDDACTDALQEKLNEGWQILAVCPPNAQRRPDYILGRYIPGRKQS